MVIGAISSWIALKNAMNKLFLHVVMLFEKHDLLVRNNDDFEVLLGMSV